MKPAKRQPQKTHFLLPPKRSSYSVKVADYDNLRLAIREFRKLAFQRTHRRDGQPRYDYFVKASQLRRTRRGNSEIVRRVLQRGCPTDFEEDEFG